MSRNRVIYNVLSMYAGQNDAISGSHSNSGDIAQLSRVYTFNTDFSRNITSIDQYGNLGPTDRAEIIATTVKSSFSYYLTDGSNENYVGLNVPTAGQPLVSFLSGYLTKATDQKNYFVIVSNEGNDAVGYSSPSTGVIGIGNAFVTSYEVDAAVGKIPTATVHMEGSNLRVYTAASGTDNIPAINPFNGLPVTGVPFILPTAMASNSFSQVSALQPSDLILEISGLIGVNQSDLKIQSFKMDIPMARQPMMRIGNKFPFSRELDWPVKTNFSISAELGELRGGSLSDILCETGVYTINVSIANPSYLGNGSKALVYKFCGARLLRQNIISNINSSVKFEAEFEAYIGALNDQTNVLFISGSYPI